MQLFLERFLDPAVQKPKLKHMQQCLVPENIHTPTTEGNGNSGGVGGGGGQRPRKFWRGGGLSGKLHFQMFKFDAVTTQFENRFLSTLQTFYIEKILSQVFDTQSWNNTMLKEFVGSGCLLLLDQSSLKV